MLPVKINSLSKSKQKVELLGWHIAERPGPSTENENERKTFRTNICARHSTRY